MRRSVVLAVVSTALVVGGCGGTTTERTGADVARGKELFTQKCGGCHTFADAGTQGQIGPNLDDAFAYARADGFDENTFFETTLAQMRIPAPPMPDYDDPTTKDYLEQADLVNIAAYVAQCTGSGTPAGDPVPGCSGAQPAAGADEMDGEALFSSQGCGGCHVLSAASSEGTQGPSLDEAKPSVEEAAEQIANGGGGMPAYADRLSEEQIQALAEYVSEAAGG